MLQSVTGEDRALALSRHVRAVLAVDRDAAALEAVEEEEFFRWGKTSGGERILPKIIWLRAIHFLKKLTKFEITASNWVYTKIVCFFNSLPYKLPLEYCDVRHLTY